MGQRPVSLHPSLELFKLLALVSMTVDHLKYVAIQTEGTTLFGRLAFPLFAMLLAYFFTCKTRDKRAYQQRLFWVALLSQIPYSFLEPWYEFNILFTLLGGTLLYEVLKNRKNIYILPTFVLAIFTGFSSYGFFGMMLIYMLMRLFESETNAKKAWWGLAALLPVYLLYMYAWSHVAVATAALVALYGAIRASEHQVSKAVMLPAYYKYLFYAYYPAHLAVLAVWRVLLT